MGDYGAWQVALWQNADVVLFFLKTDYYYPLAELI